MATTKKAQAEDLDFLDEDVGFGLDAVDEKRPRLQILQATPAGRYRKGSTDYLPGAQPGFFFNTVTKKVYEPPIQVIPLYSLEVWQVWSLNEKGEKDKFHGRFAENSITVIGNPFEGGRFDKKGNGVFNATEIYCLVRGEEEEGPVCLSFTSTGITYAKKWLGKMDLLRTPKGNKPAIYKSIWEISTDMDTDKNSGQQWFSLGKDKVVYAEHKGWIPSKEFEAEFIKPAVDLLLDTVTKFEAIGAPHMALIEAPEEEAHNF